MFDYDDDDNYDKYYYYILLMLPGSIVTSQQIFPCCLQWRTFHTVWSVVRCATRLFSGNISFYCFHNYLCSAVKYSNFFLFAYDV